MKDKEPIKWFDNAKIITTLIICTIALMVICSQSFVVVKESSIRVFSSVINHNTIYLLILIYFICLKTSFGKKNFNYINVFLIFIYFILSVTSFLTIIQSFSINTVVTFLIYFILLIYLFHTMFRDTRVWKEFKLGNSPFNEITNDIFYSTILILVSFALIVNLISTVVLSGLVVSILEAIYVSLLARYIYLYREYLDNNKKDIDNRGNFDKYRKELSEDFNEIKGKVSDVATNIKEKGENFIKENEIDDKIKNIKEKGEEFIKDNKIDEKVNDIKDKVVDTVKGKDTKTDEKTTNKKKSTKKTTSKSKKTSEKGDKK